MSANFRLVDRDTACLLPPSVDHDTICSFLRRFLGPLSDLFTQILQVAHQMGLMEVGDVAIDGSKANASKHKAMSWKRDCQLEDQLSGEVAELMERAEQVDAEQVEAQSDLSNQITDLQSGILRSEIRDHQSLNLIRIISLRPVSQIKITAHNLSVGSGTANCYKIPPIQFRQE